MDTALKIRKHLTPLSGMRAAVAGGDSRREVRREVSERVTLKGPDGVHEGWTLNVSRGGVRIIVERRMALGQVLDVTVGSADASPLSRQGRVVWFQEEADGFIVGVAFLSSASGERPATQ
jgi:PilZ domain